MAINLYIQLKQETLNHINDGDCFYLYKEMYRFYATGDDANADIRNYRLRHFLTANCPNSTVTPKSGLCVYDGNSMVSLTGSYNDWTTPDRPPRFDEGNNQFNTELIMRFDKDTYRTFRNLPNNAEAWITAPYTNDNGTFAADEVQHAFSYLGMNNGEFVKNPLNVVLEHKVGGGSVSRIYTDASTLPASGAADCEDASNLYQVETVVVETSSEHNLSVGDTVTLYSKSVSDVSSYTGNSGRMFGKAPGERYLGDFIVTSVPTSTSFTYQTYHSPMLINQVTPPAVYTSSDWNDLEWERWEMYEYTERVDATPSGGSIVFRFTGSDPSGISCKHNFIVGDRVAFTYNTSGKVHMEVTETSSTGITAVPVAGETFPSNVSSGNLVYTGRLPSSDVACNLEHDDIAPQKAKSHAKETVIIYACQDTYYASEGADVSHGTETAMSLVKNQRIPIIQFPVPLYEGSATEDPDLKAKIFVYNTADGGIGNNTINVMGFNAVAWTESNTNTEIAAMHEDRPWTDTPIGTYSYGNQSRELKNRYINLNIDNQYMVSMLKGTAPKSIYLNSTAEGQVSDPIQFATRHATDNWPYIAVTSATFIAKKPTISIKNTYMYLVCDSIQKGTYGSGTAFVATVSNKLFNPSDLMYVRSWDDNKPFFAQGDVIEIMNTEHYNTVSAVVLGVSHEEGSHKVYFNYPDGAPDVELGVLECGIIRNRSRMISTYEGTDVEKVSTNLTIGGPDVLGDSPYAYDHSDDSRVDANAIEFDVIHEDAEIVRDDETLSPTELHAVYDDSNNTSNEVTPIILTDLVIENTQNPAIDRDDRFRHVGPCNTVILKGFNLRDLSPTATAVLGDVAWEDGIDNGQSVTLQADPSHIDERKFEYSSNFNLQREMPVYGLRNVNNAVTEFKLKASDCPFIRGDVLAPILTGRYVDGTHSIPPVDFKYGANYYLADNPVEDVEDTSYVWVRLSSSYISRFEEQVTDTPTYLLLDAEYVDYIDTICQTGTLMPLILYSTITSVTIKDTDVDTKYYYNRLYLQIDEEAPICYVPEDEHYAGQPFDVYISDLNDIYKINDSLVSEMGDDIVCLLGNGDTRFIKLTLTLNDDAQIPIYDAAGNLTTLDFAVIKPEADIDLVLSNISSSGTTHTLNFTVTGKKLSNDITSTAGDAGIYASFGSITNVGEIEYDEYENGRFTFDVVIDESTIGQTNGHLDVWAGDTNEGQYHKSDMWAEPIVFKQSFKCVKVGDTLTYNGVNLYNDPTEHKELVLRNSKIPAFTIDSAAFDNSGTSLPIKVGNYKGTENFFATWKDTNASRVLSNYRNEVEVIPGPIIYIDGDRTVHLKKGTEWHEPSPWDVLAFDGYYNNISDRVEIENPDTPEDVQHWWDKEGTYEITYTVEDDCGNPASVTRHVVVTLCDIPIILVKAIKTETECPTFDPFEDIELMISPESHVLFNQNFMNNVVEYQLPDSDDWLTATILSGTPDRKRLTIKNPGVISSDFNIRVNIGTDNIGADGCYWTNTVCFNIASKEEQDKPLDVDGKASIVKKKNSVSRFDDLNFEPIYNKDLSYSSFTITADENSLMQNVYSILLTNLGERLYDDEFGSTLEESVFEIIGDLNGESKLLNECVNLINKYEPRVVVVEDKSYVAINEDNTVVIVLYIKVPRGIARKIELTFRKDS